MYYSLLYFVPVSVCTNTVLQLRKPNLLLLRTAEDVDVSVLRCYLLIRHYAAAIMWTAGIKPAEPHCSLKTLQIMREIMESPVRNADGSGAMLAIRIPSSELATLAYETLKNTRDRYIRIPTCIWPICCILVPIAHMASLQNNEYTVF